MKQKENPKVVIVGRMNVGKSTLFNRLSVSVKSLAFDYEGVTRDFLQDTIWWNKKKFDIFDTGGVSLKKSNDPILERVRLKALDVVQKSKIVLFVCDGKLGITSEDQEIAKLLHKLKKDVIVVVNKVDNSKDQENIHEFHRFGHKDIIPISAQHGLGVGDLLEVVEKKLPESFEKQEKKEKCRIVLLGKPNVGKSSLMNLLLNKDRSLVMDMPGTTREAITEKVTFYQEDIAITDTAGVRRKRSINETLETLMVKSSFRALEKADVVLLLIDGSQGYIADQELKLLFYAFEKKKAVVLLLNKQDLATEQSKQDLEFDLLKYKHLIKKIVRINISCKDGKNVGRVLKKVKQVSDRFFQTFDNDEINIFFKEAITRRPLYHNTNPLKIRHARQISTGPITILMIVNEPKWFGTSELMYFENQMRRKYDLVGVPIKFVTRKKD